MNTKLNYKQNEIWENVVGLKATPSYYYEPKSLYEIQAIIQEAEAHNFTVRAVGSGHSFSDIAINNEVLINPTTYLNKILPLEADGLTAEGKQLNLVKVEGGIKIQDLNSVLDNKGLALMNMGVIDEQSISGAISTNTHGSGMQLPALPGMVKSMVIVSSNGQISRIEPSNGITAADKYDDAAIQLIQDDDIFYSAVVGLGCMGIVYSYILEVQQKFWLCESRRLESWEEVKRLLLHEQEPLFQEYEVMVNQKIYKKKPRSVSILVNPFELRMKDRMEHACIVIKTMEVDEPSVLTAPSTLTRNWVATILSKIPIVPPIVLNLVNSNPERAPNIIQTSLTGMQDEKFVSKSFKVLHHDSEKLMSKAYGCEFAYPYKTRKFIDAVEAVFEKMKTLKKERKPTLFPSSPLGLRFVKASKFYLAPEYQQDVCYIANPVLVGQNRAKEIVDYYQDIHIEQGGKPHWGKMTNKMEGNVDMIRKWYPKFDNWQKVMKQFNPYGTFSNDFSKRMNLTCSAFS